MATAGSSLPLEWCWIQTVENCKFFNHEDAEISLITTQEALGAVKAIILKTEKGKREPFLSHSAATYQEALQGLHQKSAEAVQNYININNFEHVPALNRRARGKKGTDGDDDDDDASVTSDSALTSATLSDVDTSSGCESLSDGDTVSIFSGKGAKKSRKSSNKSRRRAKDKANNKSSNARRSRVRSRSRSRSRTPRHRSASNSSSSDVDVLPFRHPRPPMPFMGAGPRLGRMPALPPGGWCPPPLGPPRLSTVPLPPPPPGSGVTPPPPGGPTFPGPPVPLHPLTAGGAKPRPQGMMAPWPMQDVRLHIFWKRHGEKLVLDQCRASLRSIQEVAVGWTRRHVTTFPNVSSFDTTPPRLSQMRALVRKATIDGEDYDMSSYSGDDLRKLMRVAGEGSIPRFEIEIETPVYPPPPPTGFQGPPGGHPGSSPSAGHTEVFE